MTSSKEMDPGLRCHEMNYTTGLGSKLTVLIEQVAYSMAVKVMERLQTKIDNASYMETLQTADVLSRIWR
jgi:acetyl-CoA carboxylase beta subunit